MRIFVFYYLFLCAFVVHCKRDPQISRWRHLNYIFRNDVHSLPRAFENREAKWALAAQKKIENAQC